MLYVSLCLLRKRGETVVFERKGEWYRFSDEGVILGTFLAFYNVGYLSGDTSGWYLSDLLRDSPPFEGFDCTTVVLVSPKLKRIHEFLKPNGPRVFMSVWGLDELLECRLAVFPDVKSTAVKEAFEIVGCVARAVFSPIELAVYKAAMIVKANGVSVEMLRQVFSTTPIDLSTDALVSTTNTDLSTDAVGDLLFHIFPSPDTGFNFYTVGFASN